MQIDAHPLFTVALILTAGLAGGEAVARFKLPRVTGWILTGILLRSFGAPGVGADRLAMLRPFTDFVLGYIAFTVGSHLNLRRLYNAGLRLGSIVVTEATLTPLLVAITMVTVGGLKPQAAALLAAIAVAGAPGTTLSVIRENRGKGVFVKTLLGACALIDMVAVCIFESVHVILKSGADGLPWSAGAATLGSAAVRAGSVLLGSAVVGLGVAVATIAFTQRVVGSRQLGVSLLGAMAGAWSLSVAVDKAGVLPATPILATTFLGMFLANLMSAKEEAGEAYLATFQSVFFTLFFTTAGIRLDFSRVVSVAGLVGLFIGVRLAGKVASAWISMRAAGAPAAVRDNLGLALMPHGGVAVGLTLVVLDDPSLAAYHETILAVSLSALAVNQLIGPSLVRMALEKAGESEKDHERLLDFLDEEHILTNFRAETKEEAITVLVDHLIKTHELGESVDKKGLLQKVLDREADFSTCLGEGLMIPHGELEGASEIVGVMALSPGLPFETPDDKPVRCVVLLATPANQAERHLAVLAALAKALGADPDFQRRLLASRTSAHAYRVMHGEDAEDFNYFLGAALEDGEASR